MYFLHYSIFYFYIKDLLHFHPVDSHTGFGVYCGNTGPKHIHQKTWSHVRVSKGVFLDSLGFVAFLEQLKLNFSLTGKPSVIKETFIMQRNRLVLPCNLLYIVFYFVQSPLR